MLLLALTTSTLADKLREHQEFCLSPGWFLTIVVDKFLSSTHVTDDNIAAFESLFNSDGDSLAPFITAQFDRAKFILTIFKAPLSGRPAYYHRNSRGEFFFSTHISLLRVAGVDIKEDPNILPELCIYRVIAPPRTMYKDVQQLAASGILRVRYRPDGFTVTVDQGYKPATSPNIDYHSGVGSLSEKVSEVLTRAILPLRPTRSSVAVLLSGGLDSSILLQIAKIHLSVEDTYSSAYPFEDPRVNFEKQYAWSAAEMLGTKHALFEPTVADYLVGFVEAIAAAETPIHHLQSVLLYLLFKRIRPEHRVLLSGEAADSAFGLGFQYELNHRDKFLHRVLSLPLAFLLFRILGSAWQGAAGVLEALEMSKGMSLKLSDSANPIWMFGSYGDYGWVESRYNVKPQQIVYDRYAAIRWSEGYDINTAIALYALNYCEVNITTAIWSKLAEAQGKVLYYPFAAQEVLDLAFTIPWEKKLASPKQVLRDLAHQLGIPEAIITRPKRSFGISPSRWAGRNGIFEPLIPLASRVIDIADLRALQGTAQRQAMTFWALLNYAVWKRLFILNEPKELLLQELAEGYAKSRQ